MICFSLQYIWVVTLLYLIIISMVVIILGIYFNMFNLRRIVGIIKDSTSRIDLSILCSNIYSKFNKLLVNNLKKNIINMLVGGRVANYFNDIILLNINIYSRGLMESIKYFYDKIIVQYVYIVSYTFIIVTYDFFKVINILKDNIQEFYIKYWDKKYIDEQIYYWHTYFQCEENIIQWFSPYSYKVINCIFEGDNTGEYISEQIYYEAGLYYWAQYSYRVEYSSLAAYKPTITLNIFNVKSYLFRFFLPEKVVINNIENKFFSSTSSNRYIGSWVKKKNLLSTISTLMKTSWYYHIVVIYKNIKTILLPISVTILVGVILIDYFHINLLKQLAVWSIFGLLVFWLLSGFNFFIKRYRYGKFTSAILRFWKRTNSVFWIIEGFLFSLFFYYYINSSQEPTYFYDQSSLNNDFLLSLPNTYWSYSILIILIWYLYIIILCLPQFTIRQTILHLTIITLGLLYIFLLESYQFYYILTIFFENIWVFNFETNLWSLEVETPQIRVKQQYLLLALIAKFWHFIFIFISWLFFIFKSYEQRKVNYIQLGVNLQNLLILFGLNIIFIVQWGKWLIRRYWDSVYYWFFTNSNTFSITEYINEFNILINVII